MQDLAALMLSDLVWGVPMGLVVALVLAGHGAGRLSLGPRSITEFVRVVMGMAFLLWLGQRCLLYVLGSSCRPSVQGCNYNATYSAPVEMLSSACRGGVRGVSPGPRSTAEFAGVVMGMATPRWLGQRFLLYVLGSSFQPSVQGCSYNAICAMLVEWISSARRVGARGVSLGPRSILVFLGVVMGMAIVRGLGQRSLLFGIGSSFQPAVQGCSCITVYAMLVERWSSACRGACSTSQAPPFSPRCRATAATPSTPCSS